METAQQYAGQYAGASVAAQASAEERAAFIRRTYQHLAGAILAFMAVEFAIFQSGLAAPIARGMLGISWLLVLGGFMVVAFVADKWARSAASRKMQYFGLGLYVVAEAIFFVPLLYIAVIKSTPDTIPMAAVITGLLFLGLTVTAFTTRADFSFLGVILKVVGCVALGVIVCSLIFGFTLGLIFSSIMVAFACGAILYSTSRIIHQYNTDQHVAASLSLFASVALLFWYVLRILMSLSSGGDD
jgi:FtsH-binding integral membrane protein